ncbi:necrosis inducing [Gonapodya prolifera JEL478]|uniref:Necrosis inducing n=1 Tax=Gonapodya prolifera (strain JEL478) TaxID=1344416 RepID=A0A139AGC2_GONPJ|nr:necrosis inducing [Gonapodya prolifera JEL478]|eukprot:KXS15846.1 necrosis inducing [Gonapodya prolifera JEL478]
MPSLTYMLTLAALASAALASDFPSLDQALPQAINILSTAAVFDFDTDGCLPSAAVSRSGAQNGGLKPTGSITGGCRRADFMSYSNTYHRYACIADGGSTYCAHYYALYFLKDQATVLGGGHRHDIEHAVVWTKDGVVTHGGYSAHGDLHNAEASTLDQQNGHLKFVYHKDGVTTHAMRFAKSDEVAENSYGTFVTPPVVSWFTMKGDGIDNARMRQLVNGFDFGSAHFPILDGDILNQINKFKPDGYPTFTQASVDNSL